MSEANLLVKKGEVIVFTKGEYSDFGIDGYVVAIADINLKECAHKFVKIPNEWEKTFGFVEYLIGCELVIPVAHREIHIGSYGEFDDDFGIQRDDDE